MDKNNLFVKNFLYSHISEIDFNKLKEEFENIKKVIRSIKNSLKVEDYALKWKEIFRYKLKPQIEPKRGRIRVYASYNEKKVLVDENGEIIEYELESKDENSFIIQLKDIEINEDFKLFYTHSEVKWESLDNKYEFKKLYFEDGKEVKILTKEITDKNCFIETTEEIKVSNVKDENNNVYNLEKVNKNQVYIQLEDEETQNLDDDNSNSKIDIFLELVSSNGEILENPDKKKGIKVERVFPEEYKLLLDRKPHSEYVYPPKNTYQIDMQRMALETLFYRPFEEHIPLLNILLDKEKAAFEEPVEVEELEWKFLTDESRKGTKSQREFVKKAISTPDFAILEGPPGSGKTTAITELIYQLIKKGKKILLVASTHVAVDNVLEKIREKNIEEIVPVRVGKENIISEAISEYHIDKKREKFKKLFETKDWFKTATQEEKEEFLNDIIIHSSNLVCGTTIGILQYPLLKSKRDKYIYPEFDYMIIDEASKTNFLEFLVPAIFAKRWIIVGDVKQLAPYTETLHIKLMIDNLFSNEYQKKALIAYLYFFFELKKQKNKPKFIYATDKNTLKEIIEVIREKKKYLERNISYVFITSDNKYFNEDNFMPPESISLAKLLTKDIIFVEESIFKENRDRFPLTHVLITNDENDIHHYRHLYWYRKRRNPYNIRSRGSEYTEYDEIQQVIKANLSRDWADELAWRLKRIQELEYETGNEGSKKYYKASVYALMPKSGISRDLKSLSQIFMTSIIKALQEGVNKDWENKEVKTSFSHGLPESVKEKRFTTLEYQYRMHKDISKIPRELFYDKKALKDDPMIDRNWKYEEYKNRIVWIDVPYNKNNPETHVKRNKNETEAKVIIKELEKFVNWASKQDKKYTAIILSFYEAQRKLIRDLLRNKYPENKNKQTRFNIKGVDVRVYTVDKVQGREGDIVFLSMTQNKRVGFMDSPNRLNVAITRAKYQLVVVGDIQYFGDEQKQSKTLKNFARKIKNLYEVRDYGEI